MRISFKNLRFILETLNTDQDVVLLKKMKNFSVSFRAFYMKAIDINASGIVNRYEEAVFEYLPTLEKELPRYLNSKILKPFVQKAINDLKLLPDSWRKTSRAGKNYDGKIVCSQQTNNEIFALTNRLTESGTYSLEELNAMFFSDPIL